MVGGKRIDDPRRPRSADGWSTEGRSTEGRSTEGRSTEGWSTGRPRTGRPGTGRAGSSRPPSRPTTQRRPISGARARALVVAHELEHDALAEAFEARGLSVVLARDLREAALALDGERLDAALVALGLEDTAQALELVSAAISRRWGSVRTWSVRLPEADDDLARAARACGVDELIPPSAPPAASAATVAAALARAEVARVGSAALAGPLDDLSVAELVQHLVLQRRRGTLRVHSLGIEGRIALGDGAVRHAEFGGDRGEDALFRLFALRGGDFWFEAGDPGPDVTIARAPQALLVEALARAMR